MVWRICTSGVSGGTRFASSGRARGPCLSISVGASDRVDPDVLLAINEGDADNRHLLRNEFAEAHRGVARRHGSVKQDVQAGNFAHVTEFAQIKAKQTSSSRTLPSCARDVDGLEPRVRASSRRAFASQEMTAMKRLLVGALVLPTVVGIIAAWCCSRCTRLVCPRARGSSVHEGSNLG
jgi:hypothetical protein